MRLKNFGEFFNESHIPMWIYDTRDYSIKDINKEMIELFGYSREQMLTFTLFDLRPEEEIPKLRKHLAQAKNNKFSKEGIWKYKKKNGKLIYVYVISNPVTFEGDSQTYQLAMHKDITEEMNARISNEMLFKNSLDGVMLTNPNGDIMHANQAACDILGMTEKEIMERGREGIVAKDRKLEKALKERSKTGKFTGELNYIHKKGYEIPVEVTTSVFVNYAGEKRTSLTFRDISDRKEQERALQEEKEFTETVLNSLPGLFYVLDQEGKIVRFNNRATKVFGIPAEKINGRSPAEFVHESNQEKVPEEIRAVLEEGYREFQITLKTVGGDAAIYQFNADRLEQNGQIYIIGTGLDITEKKEPEDKLSSLLQEHGQRKKVEADRNKLQEMFEEAPTPKCLLEGPDLRYAIANKAYRQLVGEEYIIGKRVVDVVPEVKEQGYMDVLEEVYRTGEAYLGYGDPVQIDKRKEDSSQNYIFNLLFMPLFDEDGEVYGIFIEAMDFSKQIAYQQQLKKSLKEKDTLLAEIHHRVKNNLAIITGMMELQATEAKEGELRDSLRVAQQRIRTIANIHELLYGAESLSHLNFGENLKQLVQNLEEVYNSSKRITATVEAEPISMNINQAIPCALLVNEVVTNAYKHAFKDREEGEIKVRLQEKNENVTVEIFDNGVGLPADFSQDSYTSIGITLIKLLKQQLKGEITFSNQNGTRFELTFKKADVKGIGSNLLQN
ncbi:PAS domain S-box protein [Aliifodinibius sp. S!AR15-10]|uniref:PAS domain-containing sensor histidine kinase n=1 Tax=Aliifodinibius sp. S!AR15-10 TaxID=2950437 RepID=UPI002860C05B|nr:PAS domain S-box protein [Aliifodinibius sp. S!AR15-10]MDR8390047.1 PAS domain S-box protein [Aliifodinibius sp. S!AR15-10]